MPQLGSFWMIISSISFAFMGLFVKLLSPFLQSQEIVFWRMAFASIALLLFAKIYGFSLKTHYIKKHIIRGLVGTVALIFYFYAVTHLPLATAVTLSYTSVIWMVIFSVILAKQKVSIPTVLCALIGLLGVIILLHPSVNSGQAFDVFIGSLTGVLSSLAYLQVRELTLLDESEWKIVFYFSLIATIVTGWWSAINGFHQLINWYIVQLILGLGISALIGQLALTLAYAQGNMLLSAILSYLTVIFSFLLGYFILEDRLGLLSAIGILVIILSAVLSTFISQWSNRKLRFINDDKTNVKH